MLEFKSMTFSLKGKCATHFTLCGALHLVEI